MSLCVCLRAHRSPSYTSALCGVICGGSRTVTFGCRNTDLLPFQTALKMNLVCPDHSNMYNHRAVDCIIIAALIDITGGWFSFCGSLPLTLLPLGFEKEVTVTQHIRPYIYDYFLSRENKNTVLKLIRFTNVSVVEWWLTYIVKGKQRVCLCLGRSFVLDFLLFLFILFFFLNFVSLMLVINVYVYAACIYVDIGK